MAVYLGGFLVSEILAFYALKFNYKSKIKHSILSEIHIGRLSFILSAIPFFLIAALRYKVGTDYTVYSTLQIPEVMSGVYDRVELLYRYVIKIGMAMGNDQWVFVITHALIIGFIWASFKESDNICVSIFVFLFGASFNMSLNIMRQYIAIAIGVFALKYIIKNKPIHYYIWILVAFLFHTTAIIFALFYPLSKIKLKSFMPLIIVAISMGMSIVAKAAITIFTYIVPSYAKYIGSKFDVNDTQYDLILLNFAILFIGCAINYYYREKEIDVPTKIRNFLGIENNIDGKKMNLYVWLQTLTCVFACVSGSIPNSTRIIFIPAIGQILYIPMLLKRSKHLYDGKVKINAILPIYIMFALIYLVMFLRIIIFKNMGETKVYHSIF